MTSRPDPRLLAIEDLIASAAMADVDRLIDQFLTAMEDAGLPGSRPVGEGRVGWTVGCPGAFGRGGPMAVSDTAVLVRLATELRTADWLRIDQDRLFWRLDEILAFHGLQWPEVRREDAAPAASSE